MATKSKSHKRKGKVVARGAYKSTRVCGGCRATLPVGEMREERQGETTFKWYCGACVSRRMVASTCRGPDHPALESRLRKYEQRAALKLPLFD
jgi:hypothetical protein